MIPQNWYLETELRHGTLDWDELNEGLLLTFSFKDGWDCIDDALQDNGIGIFQTPNEPLAWDQPAWDAQLKPTIECYKMTAEEDEEDPRNVNIPESKGQHEF